MQKNSQSAPRAPFKCGPQSRHASQFKLAAVIREPVRLSV